MKNLKRKPRAGYSKKALDKTYSRDILDKLVVLVNRYAWREIKRLRAKMEKDSKEGMELFAKHSMWSGGSGLPHEVEDFLQSLGE